MYLKIRKIQDYGKLNVNIGNQMLEKQQDVVFYNLLRVYSLFSFLCKLRKHTVQYLEKKNGSQVNKLLTLIHSTLELLKVIRI